MRKSVIPMILALCSTLSLSSGVFAHAQPGQPEPQIAWQKGPTKGNLGGFAEIDVPQGFLFTDKAGAQKLLELTHNLPSGDEVGALVPKSDDESWFVIFEFNESGFVKDDERKLDADALLSTIREGSEDANKVRQEKGWPAFHVTGWEKQPFYDPATQNLTWAIRGRDDTGGQTVNHSIRVLGRRGTMNVDLVLAPDEYAKIVPQFDKLMNNYSFSSGHRYSEYIAGDKLAGYGLTALIAGGAGAAAVKTGLIGKLWKFLLPILLLFKKFIIVVLIALAGLFKGIKNWYSRRAAARRELTATIVPPPIPEETKS